MPKKPSVKKGAAAQFQNWKAVQAAVDGKGALNFMSVMKAMGNGYFQLCTADGKLFQGTPRGLFGKGAMRIDVGQIAIAEGALLTSAGSKARVLEIVGVIRERHEAEDYVRKGKLPAKVLELAISAGTMAGAEDEKKRAAKAVDEAVEFAGSDEEGEEGEEDEAADGEPAKGGLKQSRAKAATMRAISSRAALLMKGGGGGMRVELGEEMDARALAEGDLYWEPPKVRKAKPKALLPAYVEPVEATPAEDAAGMGFSLYSAGGCRVASEEVAESVRIAEEQKLSANVAALRAKLAAAPVRENWDDEVDIDDL
jgi:hypothetical protein